jgi:hypothetical protein
MTISDKNESGLKWFNCGLKRAKMAEGGVMCAENDGTRRFEVRIARMEVGKG